ncbi:MAG: gliding motility protein GldL [Candidatus Cyclobacteriaceae bacterium M3_2C_046]
MSRKKGGFVELLYTTIMPKIYGIGAAIVIVGALFKIQHFEGAGIMLGVGLTVEAIIFFLSAFEPKHPEPDWSKVYPELAEDYDGPPQARSKIQQGSGDSVTKKLDHMLESSKVGPELINSLGMGMKKLSDSVVKISSLGDTALATNDFNKNIQAASGSLLEVKKSYESSAISMNEMATITKNSLNEIATASKNTVTELGNASRTASEEINNAFKDTKEYHTQVQSITKNLGALNAVYEMELNDVNGHLKAMNKFYSNLTTALESMSGATKDTEQFKDEINKLTSNLSSLNKVYGSMLTAMKS